MVRDLTADILEVVGREDSFGPAAVPELMNANAETLRGRPITARFLEDCAGEVRLQTGRVVKDLLADIRNIPQLTYSKYFVGEGVNVRPIHKPVYMEKRGKLSAAAIHVLMGYEEYIEVVHDYLWSICEETTWVPPQHTRGPIDLFASGTGFDLAEIVVALNDRLDERVVTRVRETLDERILTPYLEQIDKLHWFKGSSNWNGVCNGGVGATALLVESSADRRRAILEQVMEGLDAFLATAFHADGSSGEGVGYWHYGLSNVVCLFEMIRDLSGGDLDLLATDRMRQIAAFPAAVMLSPARYFSYSDSHERGTGYPGLLQRLAERTGVNELLAMLGGGESISAGLPLFHHVWRNMLWWDGDLGGDIILNDSHLEHSGLIRLISRSSNVPVSLAAKAGHNAVPHNHNDVGTFVLHVDGQTFLCDPGSGRYSAEYFGPKRYENPYANSYGHSVPRIDGTLQSEGESFSGEILTFDTKGPGKRVEMRIDGAYDVQGLDEAIRTFVLDEAGDWILEDSFRFSGKTRSVEEALMTLCDVQVDGACADVVGADHTLRLTIETPENREFALEVMEDAAKTNGKPALKRLSFGIPVTGGQAVARVRMEVTQT